MSMEDCIFDRVKLKEKINDIIDGLKDAVTTAANANNELQSQINKCITEKEIIVKKEQELASNNTKFEADNQALKTEIQALKTANENLKQQNETLSSESDTKNQELTNQNNRLIEENRALEETNSKQTNEIKNLKTELETQKKTSEDNMNKIISTLAAERNQLLQRLQREAEAQAKAYTEEAQEKAQAALADAEAKENALAEAKREAEQEKEAALAEAKKNAEEKAAEAKKDAEEKAAEAKKDAENALAEAKKDAENALAEAKAEAEKAKAFMESNKTESMKNIEKIEQQLGVNIQDIQSKLWEASKTYMTTQYGTEGFKDNIADDPFVQAELKTLLNDTTEPPDAVAIQEAHKNVITRHYKTLYPNASDASDNDIMTMKSPVVKDHVVIPPYLYLSLTDYFVVFSVTNKNINMRFLDSSGNNNKDHNELSLEKGFHIIIKKLGNGIEDFFSRIDVKFVLLNNVKNASTIISEVFKESTFYGHIPTQTILSIDQSNSTSTSTSSRGGNKTLKNNKKKLKKKKKYTQNRHIMKKLKH